MSYEHEQTLSDLSNLSFNIDQEKLQKIKADEQKVKDLSELYSNKYKTEIEEGDKKIMLLLEDGKKKGLNEKEVLNSIKTFIPSSRTPRLNFLYYFMNEKHEVEEERENSINFYGLCMDGFTDTDEALTDEERNEQREIMDKLFGKFIENYNIEDNEGSFDNVPIFDTTVLGDNVTHDIFKKIKKLKALSYSDNENEAIVAYKMGIKFCQLYNLDFDKIPCNLD